MSTKIIAGNATNNGASLSGDTNGVLEIATGASQTTSATFDANGNFLVGTTAGTYNYQNTNAVIYNSSTAGISLTNGSQTLTMTVGYGYTFVGSKTNHPLVFTTNDAERARIDSSGNLLVGTTTNTLGKLSVQSSTTKDGISVESNSTAATGQINFRNPNGYVGSISSTGSSTAYNTSSDYRLKENVQPMVGALDKIGQLNPVTYNWKADGSEGQGFIAHELQAVFPDAVTGEKDAVDADGNPVYQGIDTSFLVGALVSAVKELKAELDSVKTELNALKGAA